MQDDARGWDQPRHALADGKLRLERCFDQTVVPPYEGSANVAPVLGDLPLENISLIDEAGDLGVLWVCEHVRGRAALKRATVMEHNHTIRERNRFFEIVGDQHHRHPDAHTQLGQFAVELSPSDLIHSREWLVEKHHGRFTRKRPRDGDTLLLTA
jgi:hypothetical protein